jgi:hypothetical protein
MRSPTELIDPARALREVEAKRAILVEYAGARLSFEQASREPRPDPRSDNARCAAYDARLRERMAHWQAVQRIALALAAVYRDPVTGTATAGRS